MRFQWRRNRDRLQVWRGCGWYRGGCSDRGQRGKGGRLGVKEKEESIRPNHNMTPFLDLLLPCNN